MTRSACDTLVRGWPTAAVVLAAVLVASLDVFSSAFAASASVPALGRAGAMCFGGWDRVWCVGGDNASRLTLSSLDPAAPSLAWHYEAQLSDHRTPFPMVGSSFAGYGFGWLVVCAGCSDAEDAAESDALWAVRVDRPERGTIIRADGTWARLPKLPVAVKGASMIVTAAGSVVVVGIHDGKNRVFSLPLSSMANAERKASHSAKIHWQWSSRTVAMDTSAFPQVGAVGQGMPVSAITPDVLVITAHCTNCNLVPEKYPFLFRLHWSEVDPINGQPTPDATVTGITTLLPTTTPPFLPAQCVNFHSLFAAQMYPYSDVGLWVFGNQQQPIFSMNFSAPGSVCEDVQAAAVGNAPVTGNALALTPIGNLLAIGKDDSSVAFKFATQQASARLFTIETRVAGTFIAFEVRFGDALPASLYPGARLRMSLDHACSSDVAGTKPWLMKGKNVFENVFLPRGTQRVVLCSSFGNCGAQRTATSANEESCAKNGETAYSCASQRACSFQPGANKCVACGVTPDEASGEAPLDSLGDVAWAPTTLALGFQQSTVTLSQTASRSYDTSSRTVSLTLSASLTALRTDTNTAALTGSTSLSLTTSHSRIPTASTTFTSTVSPTFTESVPATVTRSVTQSQTRVRTVTLTLTIPRTWTGTGATTTRNATGTMTLSRNVTRSHRLSGTRTLTGATPSATNQRPPCTLSGSPTVTLTHSTGGSPTQTLSREKTATATQTPPPPPTTTTTPPTTTTVLTATSWVAPTTTEVTTITPWTTAPTTPATSTAAPPTPTPTGSPPPTPHRHHNTSAPSNNNKAATINRVLQFVAIGVGACILMAGIVVAVRRVTRRPPALTVTTPLLSSRRDVALNADPPSAPPPAALAGLKGCTIVQTLRRDVTRGVEVLVVDRRQRGGSELSSRRREHLSPTSPAMGIDRVVLKRVLCETGRERNRTMSEYMLLQRVFSRAKGAVVRPVDMTVSELVLRDGRYEELQSQRATLREQGALQPPSVGATPSTRQLTNPFLVTIVMEYYPAGDVQQFCDAFAAAGETIPESAILAVAHQVASALAVMHSRLQPAVLHGDVKPSNFVLDRSKTETRADDGSETVSSLPTGAVETRVLLADFGCAKELSAANGTTSGGGAMTHKYAAPECFEAGATLSAATDMFALGVTLLQMCLGAPPARILGVALQQHETDDVSGPAVNMQQLLAPELELLKSRGYSAALSQTLCALLAPSASSRLNALSLRDATLGLLGGRSRALLIPQPPGDASDAATDTAATPGKASFTSEGREMR